MRRSRCSLRFRGDCSDRGSKKSLAEFPAFERMCHGRSDHKWTSYRRAGRLPSAFLHFSCNNKVAKSPEEYHYTVLFEPAEEGGYVATCPALPGSVTEGDTLAEARAMLLMQLAPGSRSPGIRKSQPIRSKRKSR